MKQLKVERNQTYALILKPNGQEIIRLVNPKKLEEIIRLLRETLPKKVKREKTGDLGLIVIDDLPEMIGWVLTTCGTFRKFGGQIGSVGRDALNSPTH